MKRKIILLMIAILLVISGIITYTWTYTKYGRLDYWAAFSLHLLTFNREIQPDPENDLKFKIPANLFYGISMVLPKDEVFKTEDFTIPGKDANVPVRIYWPSDPEHSENLFPVLIYCHGGGFVVGSVDIFDGLARSLAKNLSTVVVSVDYRLAPKYPFPAAVNDAYSALLWVAENSCKLHADSSKIFVGGDSAGGDLAAVISLKARDEKGPKILGQILYYPLSDMGNLKSYKSYELFIDGYGLSKESCDAFDEAYIGYVLNKNHPYISPLRSMSHKNLPPALIITAGFDPLRDGGRAYATRLRKEGVPVIHIEYSKTIHGFMSVNLFSQRKKGLMETSDFFKKLLAENNDESINLK